MRAQWVDSEDTDVMSEYLTDETLLVMDLRRGHCLRVALSNIGSEQSVEFYTKSEEGTMLGLNMAGTAS